MLHGEGTILLLISNPPTANTATAVHVPRGNRSSASMFPCPSSTTSLPLSFFFSHVTLSNTAARRPEFASRSRSLCLTIPSHTISADGLTLKTQAHWRAAHRSVAHDTGARRDQLAHVLAVRALLGCAGESTLVLSASRHLGPHPDSTASRTNSCLSLPCSEWRGTRRPGNVLLLLHQAYLLPYV